MKNQVNPVAVIAIVVVLLAVIGAIMLKSGGPAEGKRPDESAGGIRTSGGKVLPTAAGGGKSQTPSTSGAN